jgi:hypothetical protein
MVATVNFDFSQSLNLSQASLVRKLQRYRKQQLTSSNTGLYNTGKIWLSKPLDE